MKVKNLIVFLLCALGIKAANYAGRVVDESGQPISYATVYPEKQPELGTATNNNGNFAFEAALSPEALIVISFIGYEKRVIPSEQLRNDGMTIILKEQPIALQETVVAAKKGRQRNKRKQIATLLHSVYVQMERDFPNQPACYSIVSDVAMQSNEKTWGMEQMIADIVVLPEEASNEHDSVQFHGRFCKRFFDAQKRAEADQILSGQTLERLEDKAKKPKGAPANIMRRAANSVDSGVVVHRALFAVSDVRADFHENMEDLKHWTVSNESENETVLTYTRKITKFLGLFKLVYERHYIVDSRTFSVRRFSEHAEVRVTIPFGYKLNADQLQLLNLMNMGEEHLQKFRVRKLRATADMNTIYQRVDNKLYVLEKNMKMNSKFIGSGKKEIPVRIKATQRITNLQTKDVQPLRKDQITRRLERQIVEIY